MPADGRRAPDVIGTDRRDRAARLTVTGPASLVGSAIALQLLVAGAAVHDRQGEAPSRAARIPRTVRATPAPTASPSSRPVVGGAEAVARRRLVLSYAGYVAGQVCLDTSRFRYHVVEETSDIVETIVSGGDTGRSGGSRVVVKITLVSPNVVSYRVLDGSGDCDA